MSSEVRVEHLTILTGDYQIAVRGLIVQAPGAADNPPLSEESVLAFAAGLYVPAKHFVAVDGETVVGYAQVRSDTLELVTSAGHSPIAIAAALAYAAIETTAGLMLWAHGEASAAAALASHWGLTPERRLLQLRRPLSLPDQPAALAENAPVRSGGAVTRIRTFRPGTDELAWLALNAAAFADHPEQGRWTAEDLSERENADWFDPAGFFLAELQAPPGGQRSGAAPSLVGFHWTKIHAGEHPLGEVYVLGVHPNAQGQHLGHRLLDAGLGHLAQARSAGRPLEGVLLYVEDDNEAALRLYQRAGFSYFSEDRQYRLVSGRVA